MKTKTTMIVLMAFVIIALGAGLLAASYMPERIASHWDAQGQVNGFTSRSFGVWFMPVLMLAMGALLLGIPYIDPLKSNIKTFIDGYHGFVVGTMVFLLYIHLLTLAWNIGLQFDLTRMLAPAMAGLFYLAGVLIGKARRNYFIGIRTPWTLHSDLVWDKTHARGSIIFKLCGLLSLPGIIFPRALFPLILGSLLPAVIYILAYSYIVYRRELTG